MKNRKKIVVVILISVTFLGLGIVLQQKAQEKIEKADDNPTIIKKGVMSEKQKEHSKLYIQPSNTKSLTLKSEDINKVIELPWKEMETNRISFSQFAEEKKCLANLVIIGTIIDKSSQLTIDENFVFTDYEIKIEEIIKDNKESKLHPDSIIIITRPGGAVTINGNTIRVIDKSYKNLIVDEKYLLFLDLIPVTGAFKAVDSQSSFKLKNDEVINLSGENPKYNTDGNNFTEIINQMKSSQGECSKGEKINK